MMWHGSAIGRAKLLPMMCHGSAIGRAKLLLSRVPGEGSFFCRIDCALSTAS